MNIIINMTNGTTLTAAKVNMLANGGLSYTLIDGTKGRLAKPDWSSWSMKG